MKKSNLKAILIGLSLKLPNLILNLFKFFLFKKLNEENVKTVLIYRIGSIGDLVVGLPAFNELRKKYRDKHLVLLTSCGKANYLTAETLLLNNVVDQVIQYQSLSISGLISLLRRAKFDLFIELTNVRAGFFTNFRNMIFAKIIGVKYGYGWKVSSNYLFSKYQFLYSSFEYESTRLLKVVAGKDLVFPVKTMSYQIPNVHVGSKLVGVVIGAKLERKIWSIKRYGEVIDYLLTKDYVPVLIGSKDDLVYLNGLLNESKCINLVGKLSLNETISLIEQCDLCIGNDTGPMHFAYAFGIKSVTLFSLHNYPVLWESPFPERNIILKSDNVPCAPCFENPCFDVICMKNITVQQVINAVEKLERF